jgi:hypothetical protein
MFRQSASGGRDSVTHQACFNARQFTFSSAELACLRNDQGADRVKHQPG